MDAIALLEADHRKVEKLLDQLDETTERAVKTREDLFSTLEERARRPRDDRGGDLLPGAQGAPEAPGTSSSRGTRSITWSTTIMAELAAVSVDDETWAAKFSVMKENLEHHIEEEEGDMFKKARQVLDEDELATLGAAMRTARRRQDSSLPRRPSTIPPPPSRRRQRSRAPALSPLSASGERALCDGTSGRTRRSDVVLPR